MIPIEHHPSAKQLTVFGFLWFVFFSILAVQSQLKTGINMRTAAFWIIAVLVPILRLVYPEATRKIYLLAAYATYPIGLFVSLIILAVLYYLVLTPIGLVLRMTGNDPMQRGWDRTAKTYWVPSEQAHEDQKYFRQF
jgi:hypothetical protein